MKRISEVHVMTILVLFAVFAFVMQAHGEGGLGNGIIPIRHLSPTTETDEFYTVQRAKDGLYEVTWDEGDRYIPVKSKTLAEDMAYALNRAHEERTCGKKRKCYGFVMGANGLESPCSEDNAR